MEAANNRVRDRFNTAVETVRVGTIIAHDKKALQRWNRLQTSQQPGGQRVGLTGAALEQAIGMIAVGHPDIVEVVQAA